MRKVLGYLLDYQRKQFDWKVYLTIALFLAVCLVFNYRLNFEDDYIDPYHGEPIKWLWMFLFQVFPYLGVCVILLAFGKVDNWIRNKDFWIRLFIGFGILAFDRSFYGVNALSEYFTRTEFHFVYRCLNWSSSLLTTMIPFMVVYHFMEKKDDPKIWYGLSWKKFDATPYLVMLGIAAIFIGIGSFMGDIQDYYPRFQHAGMEGFLRQNEWPRWLAILVYEISYGSDFFSVELFFRGYLIFAFYRILGPYVVLPMIATYCFLHFGKPLGESISSIFGGYVLGIIAMNSRNIWGGIFIHLGVAWLMELFGWLQN
ncbi:MAG: CPBP family intramembrane glutamic endopeptidase [Cyclobacteriaceae bacterium]